MDHDLLLEKFREGNIRALAKIISIVENKESGYHSLLEQLNPFTGKTHIVGFTGSPGAGKSSLIDQLIDFLRSRQKTIGIVAIDPSSPFTGGAILGDRIRMIRHSTDPGVYIRSLANRGQSGGLSVATGDVLKVIDAFGFDLIFIETVGAGQTEVDIVKTADTVVVVLNPETGDDIQAIKAGIMEIADIFAISKADLPGAGKARFTVENAVKESNPDSEWQVPVVLCSAFENKGISELFQALQDHFLYLDLGHQLETKRNLQMNQELHSLLLSGFNEFLNKKLREDPYQEIIEQVNNKKITTYTAVEKILGRIGLS